MTKEAMRKISAHKKELRQQKRDNLLSSDPRKRDAQNRLYDLSDRVKREGLQ